MKAADRDISRLANIMPPMGLMSIAAYLEHQGVPVILIDCYAKPTSDDLIRDILLTRRPALLGLSCTTSSFLDGVRVAKLAKTVMPSIRVVFGGPHVSALQEQVLIDFPVIDLVVVGEGEETMAQLVEAGPDCTHLIPGIIYRGSDGEIAFTGYRPKIIELDTLPFPAYEKLDGYPEVYKLPIFNYPTAPNTSCVTSRGCPYACSYCDRSVFGSSFRYNSAEYVYEHLKYLIERFRIRHVSFYDDLFTFNRQRVDDLTRMLTDHPLRISFNCAVRAEHIDEELIRQLKMAGCWMISLGIETGDEKLLAQHRKSADLQMLAQKIRMIKKIGIRVKGLLMMGLPGESEKSIQKSMDYVFSLPLDDFNLTKFTPFPGSPIYTEISKWGQFEEDWEKMDCMHFQFVPHGMTKERLHNLYQAFHKAHYTRPKVLWGYTAMLSSSPDSWYRFLKNIGKFARFARNDQRILE
jgi:anaerobic magnesium-protoporphyrin IX monomethyl ester cyclase